MPTVPSEATARLGRKAWAGGLATVRAGLHVRPPSTEEASRMRDGANSEGISFHATYMIRPGAGSTAAIGRARTSPCLSGSAGRKGEMSATLTGADHVSPWSLERIAMSANGVRGAPGTNGVTL